VAKRTAKRGQPLVAEQNIIASGRDAGAVIQKARKTGVKVPAIVFVPEEGVTYIY